MFIPQLVQTEIDIMLALADYQSRLQVGIAKFNHLIILKVIE